MKALVDAWNEEAEKNLVLPLDDRSAAELKPVERPSDEPPRERYIYYSNTAPVPEGVAVNTRGRSYKILADVDLTDPKASGVIFAMGTRFGGHALFVNDQKLHYVYNFLGIPPEQHFVSSGTLKPGKQTLGMEFIREDKGPHGESVRKMKLYINDKSAGEGLLKTQLGKLGLSGGGLVVGYSGPDSVSREYQAPAKFTGGTIQAVGVTVEKTA